MFVTFEGIDSSGKSTQARLLVEALSARSSRTVHFIREPGGTVISERLRSFLLDAKNHELGKMTELFLFSASRAQLVHQVILPALGRGDTVVCDRFYDSTTAYQGYGRGLDLESVRRINAIATSGTDPDLTILVDITVDEIERRKKDAGTEFDRMESGGIAFFERVRRGYLTIAQEHPERFVVVDGMRTTEEIARDVQRAVEQRKDQFMKEAR